MKKIVLFLMILVFITACGGTRNRYYPTKMAESRARHPKPMVSRKYKTKSMAGLRYRRSHKMVRREPRTVHNTEQYDHIKENVFKNSVDEPLSTFSIDVDTASYSNVRRMLKNKRIPPKGAVRIEEMINYFSYDYPNPKGGKPFSVNMEVAECPWNAKNKLLHIGIQGKKIAMANIPPMNLVFLLDVSGSMGYYNKLPLLKKALKLLLTQLRSSDKISIVVYAGSAGLVLPPTPGNEKQKILDAFTRLRAGGSTAGGRGIKLAYQVAKDNFIKNGNNRVILATDGDFNVGQSSDSALVEMIEEKRKDGIFLTVLGFGMGNYKDSKMEKLANKGNGNYAYIDTELEAKKVLVNELGATLLTIAKDVKIQVEFNPALVKSYRLIGYENRVLNNRDFADDKKDAGELGAGHTVTALYEIVPADPTDVKKRKLKYQESKIKTSAANSNEIATVKLRYKKPKESKSKLLVFALKDSNTSLDASSDNFRFSAAVAAYGMLLRKSENKGSSTFDMVLNLARGAMIQDKNGYRKEFIAMVEMAKNLMDK